MSHEIQNYLLLAEQLEQASRVLLRTAVLLQRQLEQRKSP
jgi:hypothetical protein